MLANVVESYLNSLEEREFDAPFMALLRALGFRENGGRAVACCTSRGTGQIRRHWIIRDSVVLKIPGPPYIPAHRRLGIQFRGWRDTRGTGQIEDATG